MFVLKTKISPLFSRVAIGAVALVLGTGASTEGIEVSDALRAAQQGLDATRASSLDSRVSPTNAVAGPEFHIQDLHRAPETPGAPSITSKSGTQPTRSDTWLIDAMAELRGNRSDPAPRRTPPAASQPRPESARARTRLPFLAERDSEPTRSSLLSGAEVRAGEQATDAPQEGARPTAANPLTAFLGDWMRAGDLAILEPGLTSGMPGDQGPKVFSDPGLNAVPVPWIPEQFPVRGIGPQLSGLSPNATRENPFLEALSTRETFPVASQTPAHRADPAAPPVQAATPQNLPAPPMPQTIRESPPRVPEFARPGQDEKYFRPLKRF